MAFDGDETQAHEHDETALIRAPYDLAWNKNGQRFPVPGEARWWRVHLKCEGKGKPTMLFTQGGPMHIAIDSTFADLARAVQYRPGWYTLRATDKNCVLLPDCPTAHVQVVLEQQRRQDPEKPASPSNEAVEHLCMAVRQLALYSVQRDEAICNALGQMTASLGEIQRSTAEMIRAASSGMDVASGVSLPKLPPPPPMPQLPPPPPQKTLVDFLMSPSGTAAVAAVAKAVTAPDDKK